MTETCSFSSDVSNLEHLKFEFVSNFVFRYSNFHLLCARRLVVCGEGVHLPGQPGDLSRGSIFMEGAPGMGFLDDGNGL